jgi:thiol-disulfide isomerase/thioredoxin
MDKMYLNKPVAYLTNGDISDEGKLVSQNKPALIMLQANFCGFCTVAKPAFQQVADEYTKKGLFCATIQGDGKEPDEPVSMVKIKKMCPQFKGYPTYVGRRVGGDWIEHQGGRDVESITKFADSLIQ